MNLEGYTKPRELERMSFLWSEARLVIAAAALFLGGIPPILIILPVPAMLGQVGMLLTLSWLISGVASGYLLYRWFTGDKKLFGGSNMKDIAAFLVCAVSGINLGLAGITGSNLGMSFTMNYVIFLAVAALYLVSAGYLFMRWNKFGQKLFGSQMNMNI